MIWGSLFLETSINTHTHHSHFERLWCHQEIRESFEGPATRVHFLTNRWSCVIKKLKLALGEANIWASPKVYDCWLRNILFLLWSTIHFNCSAWRGFNSINFLDWHRLSMHRLHLCSAKIHTRMKARGQDCFSRDLIVHKSIHKWRNADEPITTHFWKLR